MPAWEGLNMDFIDLLLTVCAAAAPTNCEERRVPYFSQSSVFNCVTEAAPFIATWTEEHPKWVVRRWSCGRPTTIEEKT